MVRASRETLNWIRGYYELMDTNRLAECESYFTPDAEIRIAHHPPLVGWESIDRSMRAGLSVVGGIEHEVRNAWEAEDGVLVFEVTAHYTLKDGRKVDVPGVVVAELADGKFHRQRIGADLSAVYANL